MLQHIQIDTLVGKLVEMEGFRKSASSVQPHCTIVVPVRESTEAQYAALCKGARYGIRRAHEDGIEAETSQGEEVDLEFCLNLLEETAGRQRFGLRPRDYYRLLMRELPSSLILARREGEARLVAGALILTFEDEPSNASAAKDRPIADCEGSAERRQEFPDDRLCLPSSPYPTASGTVRVERG